jgi:hypothetical protein
MEKFWMVTSAGLPLRYDTYEEARAGAERLVRYYGEKVYVLVAVEAVSPKEMPVEWKTL